MTTTVIQDAAFSGAMAGLMANRIFNSFTASYYNFIANTANAIAEEIIAQNATLQTPLDDSQGDIGLLVYALTYSQVQDRFSSATILTDFSILAGVVCAAASEAAPFLVGFDPSQLGGMVLWLNADKIVAADGTQITSANDQSGQGNNLDEISAGKGPVYRSTRWNGQPCLDFGTQGLIGRGASLIDALKGTNKECEVIVVGEWYNTSTSTFWCWGADTVSTEFLQARNATTTIQPQVVYRYQSGGVTTTLNPTGQLAINDEGIYFHSWRRDAITHILTYEQNGIIDNSMVVNDGGFDVENFTIGGVKQGATAVAQSSFFMRHIWVFNRKLTDAERANLRIWVRADSSGFECSAGMGFVSRGTSGNTLVLWILGQSNGEGRDQNLIQPTNATIANLIGWDMFTQVFSEPSAGEKQYNVYGAPHTQQGQSSIGAIIDALRAAGNNDDIFVVQCTLGGTTAPDWSNSASANPPLASTQLGVAKYRLQYALRSVPNPRVAVVIWQGESDSDTLAHAQAWGTPNWDAVRTELETWVPNQKDWQGNAVQWWKTTHYWLVELPVTAWTLGPFWSDVRTSQETWAATYVDVHIIQATNGPWLAADNLHEDDTAENSTGTNVGNDMALAA